MLVALPDGYKPELVAPALARKIQCWHSHTRAVLSSPALATWRPSRANVDFAAAAVEVGVFDAAPWLLRVLTGRWSKVPGIRRLSVRCS